MPIDNTGIKLRQFTYQLREWLPIEELFKTIDQIEQEEGKDCYGKYYVVKKNTNKENRSRKGDYSVFTRGTKLVTINSIRDYIYPKAKLLKDSKDKRKHRKRDMDTLTN